MQHPEEGIIHAWIDGALSPAEAAELEAHVGTCGECSALVADARGLVAASSRIVGHLDAVPANVIPIAARKKRLWIQAAWPAAIAATLVLGISLATKEHAAPEQSAALLNQSIRADSALPPAAEPQPPQIAAAEASVAAAVSKAARDKREEAQTTATAQRSVAANIAESRKSAASADVAPLVAATPPLPTAQSTASGAILGAVVATTAPVPAPPVSAVTRADSTVADSLRQRLAAVSDASMGARAGGGRGGGRASDRVAANRPAMAPSAMSLVDPKRADADAVRAYAGCYDLDASTDVIPKRFALVADSAAVTPGLLAVRYIDADGRLSDRILDAGWSTEAGRAIVKVSGRVILTISRTDSTVVAQSPNGSRAGTVASCK